MASDTALRREPETRIHELLGEKPKENSTKCPTIPKAIFKGDEAGTLENLGADQSFLVTLIAEYENHQEELNTQLKYYQEQLGKLKAQLDTVIQENERLHHELKDAVQRQLEALPVDTDVGDDLYVDDEIVRNLREQLQLANQEKSQAVELWQTASQELERLQRLYQEHMTQAQIHIVESQKRKDQLSNFQQLTQQLHVSNENMEMTNQHFLKTMSEQSAEISQLRRQLREAKSDLRSATAKLGELTRKTGNLQEQVQKKEEDTASARGREDASDRRLQQLQSSIRQLEARLCVALQDASQLREEKTHLEKQTSELQAKCSELESDKFEAIQRARSSLQLLEEANLQKSQALLEEKHKEENIEKMRETMTQMIQDAAMKTRKEVMNVRKQYNVQLSQMTEELSALQMECAEKQSQIDRAIREKKAMEEELEKASQQGHAGDSSPGKLEEMLGHWQQAERAKDELQLKLRMTESKMKLLEVNSSEEISRCQEMIQKLQGLLESERKSCSSVSEQRLRLQQENERLQEEADGLRRVALEAQKKAKVQISTMEHEFLVKTHGLEAQLRELEDSNQDSTAELRQLLLAQQKAASRWREEARKLSESAEMRIGNLKSELSRQRLHAQELVSQLETANEKALESEQLLQEHQEKADRLQQRLSQAEQRAAAAAQQLSVLTAQRRRAASMLDLDTI